MTFASIYPNYITRAEKKDKTKAQVDELICWLTGYDQACLDKQIEIKVDLETFFNKAPKMHPNAGLIKGVISGYRVEDIEDPLMQKIRYMDKLIDELARGKKYENISR